MRGGDDTNTYKRGEQEGEEEEDDEGKAWADSG